MKTHQTDIGKRQRPKSMAQRIKELTSSGEQTIGNSETKISGFAKIDADERYKRVAQAAYFRAEKRGFAPGGELQDWLEAEADIQQQLGQ